MTGAPSDETPEAVGLILGVLDGLRRGAIGDASAVAGRLAQLPPGARAALERHVEHVRELEERARVHSLFRAAAEHASEAYEIADNDHRLVYVNPAWEQIFGWTFHEAIGKTPAELVRADAHPSGHFDEIDRAIDGGRPWHGELISRRKDGTEVSLTLAVAPIRGADGAPLGFVAIKRPLIDPRRHDRLANTLAELKRSNAELEQFAYVASHDLSEPLRTIASFTQLLERRYTDMLDEKGKRYIYFIVDGAQRMRAMIDSLLMYSRIGRRELKASRVETGALVQQVVEGLRDLVKSTGAVLDVGELPAVHGDEGLLTQVFSNVIHNAMKFSEPERGARVTVEASEDEGMCCFCIADEGVGFDQRFAEEAFAMFRRMHERDRFEGSGIGLSIVERIVTRHGGRVWIESEVDVGTTVRFTLPAAPRRALQS